MRSGLMLIFAAATAYVGAMLVAQYKLGAQLSDLRQDASHFCMTRGTELPTLEELRAKVDQLEVAHAVELSGVEVSIEEIDPSHDTAAGAQVQARLGGVLHMTGTVARVRAQVAAKKWLWHLSDRLDATCTLTRELQHTLSPSAQQQLEPAAPSDTPAQNQANQIRDQAGAILNQQRNE
jgi:hypothetical protein